MKIFNKVRYPNGRRHIYFCGIKIISYRWKKSANNNISVYNNNKIIIIENGQERLLRADERIHGLNINIHGNNNIVRIEYPINANNSCINILNDDVVVQIGSSSLFHNVRIDCSHGIGQQCKIGRGLTVHGMNIKLCEHCVCIIGEDCMFSNSINIWATDGHSVLDKNTRQILNHADTPLIIGNHVWVGEGVRMTKRTRIYDNSICAGGAVCYKDYKQSNVVIAGNPGKVVRTDIDWDRLNPYDLELHRNNQNGG